MEEKLDRLPSLPPEVQAKVYGLLNIEVGRIVWLESTAPYGFVSLRLRFYGEKTSAVVLRPSEPIRSYPSNTAQYTIRCNQQTFTKYLNDMRILTVDVVDDSTNRLIGRFAVNLRLYLRKDESRGRSNLASDFGFANLEVMGSFPIMSDKPSVVKLGEIEICITTDYTSWKSETGVKKSLLSSFLINELRAEIDENLPAKPNEDRRLPNSYANQPREGGYRPPEVHPAEAVKVPKTAVRKIERPFEHPNPPLPVEKPPESTPAPLSLPPPPEEEKLITEGDFLERLRQRGENLRRKMEESAKVPDFTPSFVPEYESLHMQEEIPVEIDEIPADEVKFDVPEIVDAKGSEEIQPKNTVLHLTNVKFLKISITTLTVLDSNLIKDRTISLECALPTPTLQRTMSHKPSKPLLQVQSDIMRLNYKGGYDNIFDFRHESLHNVSFIEGAIKALADQSIRFRLMATDGKGREGEIGKAEIMWELLILSPGPTYSAVLELMPNVGTGKRSNSKGPSPRVKEIARLSVSLELLPEAKLEPGREPPPQLDPPITPQVEEIPTKPVSAPSEEVKTYQMYLSLVSAAKLDPRSDNTPRNPFIRYKPFLESEFVTTQVLWKWTEKQRFGHVMMTPVVASEQVIGKMRTGRLTIELWDKRSPSENELLGLVAVPLASLAEAISSGAVGIPGSVYPYICVDEARAVHNMLQHRDVGYLQMCLALGTPSQVQRLHDIQSTQPSPPNPPEPKEEPEVTIPKAKEVATSLPDFVPIQPQSHFQEQPQIKVTESVESISDITAFLNRKESPQKIPETPKPIPETKSPERAEIPPEPVIKPEEILMEIKGKLNSERIDLDEELRLIDVSGYGYISSESFGRLLNDLKIGLSKSEIDAFIEYLLANSENSTPRRVYLSDIFTLFGITPKRAQNTRHRFDITLIELTSCKILPLFPDKSVYLRLQFPLDDTLCESNLLSKDERQVLNMKSVHSCTIAEGQKLEDCLPLNIPGITIWLCRNEGQSETKILGKAVLPSEELLDLAQEETGKLVRVLCLYADKNTAIHSLNSDIIGKIRCVVKYDQEKTSELPGVVKSSELVMERHTSVEMNIPKYSLLTIYLTSAVNLDRGFAYFRSQNVAFPDAFEVFVRVSLFHESRDLMENITSKRVICSNSIEINQRFQVDVTITPAILNYIQTKTALIELVVVQDYDQELVFGTAKLSLLPLLLSSLKGEFPLLNVYGQYMGSVIMAVSLNKDDYQPEYIPSLPDPVKPVIDPKPLELPEENMHEQSVSQADSGRFSPPLVESTPVAKLMLTVESGIRICSPSTGGPPNPYVRVIWRDAEIGQTPTILRSSCPGWTSSFYIPIQESDLESIKTSPLLLILFHKPLSGSTDEEFLGKATVDISQLVRPGLNTEIEGWYHVLRGEISAGQLKIRVAPTVNLYEEVVKLKETRKSWSILTFSQTNERKMETYTSEIEVRLQSMDESLKETEDRDLMALHTQKMMDLDRLNEYFTRKITGEKADEGKIEEEKDEEIVEVTLKQEVLSREPEYRYEEVVLSEPMRYSPPPLEELPEEEEDDVSLRAPEILEIIKEASALSQSYPALFDPPRTPSPPPLSAVPATAPRPQENLRTSVESEDRRSVQSDVQRPTKKPPMGRMRAEELSRIEAIMRGSSKSSKSKSGS